MSVDLRSATDRQAIRGRHASARTTASHVVPLWDRAAEWRLRMAMIAGARSFLYLSTFYLEYDRYGTELIAALAAAAQRGVSVNLLIDGFGQRLVRAVMSRETRFTLDHELERLRRLGAQVTIYRPRSYVARLAGGGQHVKIQVSEAGEAIFASGNISRSSFERWNEYAVALRGPITRRLLESYRTIGGHVRTAHLEQLEAGLRHGPATADIELELWLCNPNQLQGRWGPIRWRGRNPVTDRLVRAIESARRSIRITSLYFKPTAALLASLTAAARRGVRLEIHHSHREALPETELPWLAAAAGYERLLAAGSQIYENVAGEHSKIVVIDDACVAFGSYNFEDAAHERLAEAMLVSRDPRLVAPAVAILDTLPQQRGNSLVTDDTLRRLPARLKVKRALVRQFSRWV